MLTLCVGNCAFNFYCCSVRFWAVLTENVHRVCKNMILLVCLYALLSCILCFHVCTHLCFHLISNVYIVRSFKNRIPFQTLEKWHNESYRYVSYIKPFGEKVAENHIYHLVKPNSIVKTRTAYRGCNVCHKFFEKWKSRL